MSSTAKPKNKKVITRKTSPAPVAPVKDAGQNSYFRAIGLLTAKIVKINKDESAGVIVTLDGQKFPLTFKNKSVAIAIQKESFSKPLQLLVYPKVVFLPKEKKRIISFCLVAFQPMGKPISIENYGEIHSNEFVVHGFYQRIPHGVVLTVYKNYKKDRAAKLKKKDELKEIADCIQEYTILRAIHLPVSPTSISNHKRRLNEPYRYNPAKKNIYPLFVHVLCAFDPLKQEFEIKKVKEVYKSSPSYMKCTPKAKMTAIMSARRKK